MFWKLTSEVDVKNYDQTLSKHKIWDLKIRLDYIFFSMNVDMES